MLLTFKEQQAIEIERIVALAKEEEKQLKEFQNNELKKSWQESIHKKKENENYLRSIKDIDYERAGPSSAISFTGEDGLRSERNKLQKDQMRRWVQEQMHEKAFQKKLDKEEDMAQAAIIRTVDNIREATEKEEQELSRFGRQSVLAQNADVRVVEIVYYMLNCNKIDIECMCSWRRFRLRSEPRPAPICTTPTLRHLWTSLMKTRPPPSTRRAGS